ncbi:pyridoxamine 5'-phosphate oxidase family protein [Actinomadura sp. PM05-2]|uniref:Pyridoxamine 5'-phosphate oxidase family protein n=1 Tax=Actinomadura parmotrematis TaxID=2864039 RepID=A0ABS7G3R9_9ACTN|nr:pyridoxamine 5'-phosphate oxidase family protein [Actinomadura parmotrematis]
MTSTDQTGNPTARPPAAPDRAMTALLDAAATVDAHRSCEFTTLAADGIPPTWPTAVQRRPDGTLLLTIGLAFAQKARNVRRDGRVALLFSEPTGSGVSRWGFRGCSWGGRGGGRWWTSGRRGGGGGRCRSRGAAGRPRTPCGPGPSTSRR